MKVRQCSTHMLYSDSLVCTIDGHIYFQLSLPLRIYRRRRRRSRARSTHDTATKLFHGDGEEVASIAKITLISLYL